MKQRCLFCLLFLAVCFSSTKVVTAQRVVKGADSLKGETLHAEKPPLLFDTDAVLEFTLTANLRALMKDRGEKTVAHPAVLSYKADSKIDSIPLTLKVRGNFRRSKVNCSFPPLLVNFPKKKVKNTVFAQQNKLKLVTHCQLEEWVVREHLVYKLYNLLTDLSFRTQLVRVTYVDSLGKRAPETHWGCLLEDEDDLAKRNGAIVSKTKQMSMSYADSLSMATVSVFEYMIGNTDWSIPYLHNIRLLDDGKTGPLPVPYDFDHAGIVEASYAKPAEQLGTMSVRERVYRGPSYPMSIWQPVFDKFNEVKPQFYALYQNDSRLDKAYVKRTLKYLDEFYSLINKPASARVVFRHNAQSGSPIKSSKGVSYNK